MSASAIKRNYFPFAITSIIAIAFSVYQGSIFIPFAYLSIVYVYQVLRIKFGPTTHIGFLSRTILSVLCYILLLQSVLVIGWVFNHEFPLMASVFIVFTALATGLSVNFKKSLELFRQYPASIQAQSSNRSDLIALLTSALAVIALVAFPIFTYHSSHPDLVLSFINNVDDSTHLSIINDQIQFNRGLTTGSKTVDKLRATVMYPAGWHASIAILFKTVSPSIQPGISTLKFYIISKILLFATLVFFLSKFSLALCHTIIKRRKDKSLLIPVSASILSVALSSTFVFDIFREGFFSFLPQLISLPVLFLIAMHIKKADSRDNYWLIAFSWAVLLCLSLSWILVVPIITIAFILYLFVLYRQRTPRILTQALVQHPFLTVVPVVTTAAVLLSMTGSTEAVNAFSAILNQGGIAVYSVNFFFLSIFAILYTFRYEKQEGNNYARFLPAIVATSLFVFALLIYFYQLIAVGSPRYYFYKVLYLIAVAAIPLITVFIVRYLVSIKNNSSIISYSVLLLISGVMAWQFINPSTVSYLAGQRFLGDGLRVSIYDNMDSYRENSHTLYYIAGHPIVTDQAISLMHTNETSSVCRQKAWEAILSGAEFSSIVEQLDKYCKDSHIKIIAASYSKNDIEKEFATNGKPSNIDVEYLYINPPKSK